MRIALTRSVAVLAWLLFGVQVLMAGASAAGHFTDTRVMVITGGSMEPTYRVGDAVILDVSGRTPEVGEAITFEGFNGVLTTHRVISQHEMENGLHLRTQGDANDSPDVDLVPASNVVGMPMHGFAYMGYVVAWVNSPVGRLLTIGPVLVLMGWRELRRVRDLMGPGKAQPETMAAGAA